MHCDINRSILKFKCEGGVEVGENQLLNCSNAEVVARKKSDMILIFLYCQTFYAEIF